MGQDPIRSCLGPHLKIKRPNWQLPTGAWDTHFHVLGPQHRFPYAETRRYTPPDAPLERSLEVHDYLGISHGLVVHANTHGFDCSVDLDAVARSNGRYFAVVRLDGSVTPDRCCELHEAGARGVRFAFNPQHGGALDKQVFERVLRSIEGLNWFVELHFEGSALPTLRSWLEAIPATVVVDHIGRIDAGLGVEQEPFQILLDLARRENYWVKLSGIDRISRSGSPYSDVTPFVARLCAAAPDRLLWGSDWPHTGIFATEAMPDDGELLGGFARFVPDETLRRRIMVDNPLRLLGL